MRRAAKIDRGQVEMVKALRQTPGVTVSVGHDDILVGYKFRTYWFELKAPETVSNKTGKVRPSEVTETEMARLATWQGHYSVVWSLDQILAEIGQL